MATPNIPGLLIPGTVDLAAQPKVKNPNGSLSTVDSSSYQIDGKEVLLPSVTPDGRHLTKPEDIIAEYKKTGRHLGVFADAQSATAYAEQLHQDYAAGRYDADPVADFLKRTPTTPSQRAEAWDAFQASASAEALTEKLKGLNLPQQVKADLWDLKSRSAPPPDSPSPSLLSQAGEAVENLGIGAVKGVGQSIIGAGRLVQMIPGVTKAVDALYGTPGISEEAMRQADTAVTPHGVAQHLGKGAEQIAELIVPGSKLAQAGELAGTRLAPKLAPIVGETVAKYAPRAAVEAAGQAGMAKIQGGDPRLAAAFGAATPALGAVVDALPQKLKDQATTQVVQALGPTKERFKAIAEKLAPNILQRGLRGSREALQEQAAATLSQVSDQLDTLLTQRGQQVISPKPVLDALETAKDAFRTTTAAGKVVEYEPRAIKQLNGLQQVLTDLGDTPTVEQFVAVRRAWDKVVSQAGGFEHRASGAIGVPLKDISEAWAKREATSAIRELLAQEVPDLAAVNKEYAFWKGLNDVLTQTLKRTQPQGPSLTRQLAEVGGPAIGGAIGASAGPAGAAGGAALGRVAAMAQNVTRSPTWRLASAQAKDRLADAIVGNDAGKIAMALSRIATVEGSKLAPARP